MYENTKNILIDEVTKIHNMCKDGVKEFGLDYEESLNGSSTYFKINDKRYKLELTCLDEV